MDLKNLEEKAVEIEVQGVVKKVVEIKGSIIYVNGFNKPIEISPTTTKTIIGKPIPSHITGYQKELNIVLNPMTSTNKTVLIKFKGTSPVREGDRIEAGLILDKDFKKYKVGEIIYLGILNQDGFPGRRDFIDGYNLTPNDAKKLGLA